VVSYLAVIFECELCGDEYEDSSLEMPPHICTACEIEGYIVGKDDDDPD
jgi:hypothetical protein